MQTEERIRIEVDRFSCMLREMFAQGKLFVDRQAEALPPFDSADSLLAHNGPYQWEGATPRFDTCVTGPVLDLDPDEAHHYLLGSMEKGMALRAEEAEGYPYHFATASDGDSFTDLLTDATSERSFLYHLNKGEPRPLEPLFIHRLSPAVQEYLRISDQLIEWRSDIEPDPSKEIPLHRVPTVAFNSVRYHAMIRDAYAEGRLMFDRYADRYPPFPKDILPVEGGDSSGGKPEACVFSQACDILEQKGEVHLGGTALRAIIRTLLTTGRGRAWKGED